MKNRKVLNVRTHIGGLHGKTSFDEIVDKLDMYLEDQGVLIYQANGKPFIRKGPNGLPDIQYMIFEPLTNTTEILLHYVAPAPGVSDDEKRSPGRPKVVA